MKQPAGFLFAMIDDMHTTVRIYMQAAEGSWPVVPITFPTISVWSQRWSGERADWPDGATRIE